MRVWCLTRVGEVALHELDLVKGGGEALVQVCGLGEHLVDDTDLGGKVVLDQVGDKVAADKPDSSQDKDCWLWRHGSV